MSAARQSHRYGELASRERGAALQQHGDELLHRVFAERCVTHEEATSPLEERAIALIHGAHLVRGESA